MASCLISTSVWMAVLLGYAPGSALTPARACIAAPQSANTTSKPSGVAAATTKPSTSDTTSARPGAHNTGPRDASKLKPVDGLMTVKTHGAVVENVDVRGAISIQADNVTLRNFRVTADGYYGIVIKAGRSGIVLEEGEVTDAKSAGIKGGGFTARRLNLHHFGSDAIKPGSGVVVEDSWIHHLGMSDGAHADAVQIRGGVRNVTFRRNHFDMPVGLKGFRPNSAFIIDTDDGPVSDVLIEKNWINGGGWSVHIVEKVTAAIVRDNVFGRDYQFGIRRIGSKTVWKNNRWWESGELSK